MTPIFKLPLLKTFDEKTGVPLRSGSEMKSTLQARTGTETFFRYGPNPDGPSSNSWFPSDCNTKPNKIDELSQCRISRSELGSLHVPTIGNTNFSTVAIIRFSFLIKQ